MRVLLEKNVRGIGTYSFLTSYKLVSMTFATIALVHTKCNFWIIMFNFTTINKFIHGRSNYFRITSNIEDKMFKFQGHWNSLHTVLTSKTRVIRHNHIPISTIYAFAHALCIIPYLCKLLFSGRKFGHWYKNMPRIRYFYEIYIYIYILFCFWYINKKQMI